MNITRMTGERARPLRERYGAIVVLVLYSCGSSSSVAPGETGAPSSSAPSVTASPSTTSVAQAGLQMTVIGDSIPHAQFCGGCTGFVAQYATTLEKESGRAVAIGDFSRDDSAGLPQIREQVTGATDLREAIGRSDVILVSVGYNNALPDGSVGVGCDGDMGQTAESYVAWAMATQPDCLQAGLDAYAAAYDEIFSTINTLTGDRPVLLIAINVHDGNLADPFFANSTLSAERVDQFHQWMIGRYDQWNSMMCDRAEAHGFVCVDMYHAFNGPAGDQPSTPLTVDGAHPSQEGNDLIAQLLGAVDSSKIV